MHKDLVEINKILRLYSNKKSSFEDTEYVLSNICKKIDDESRNNKASEYEEDGNLLIEEFSNSVVTIVKLCKEEK